MTELWSTGDAIVESLLRYAYVVLGAVVLGFVVLEAAYIAVFVAFVARWKATVRR